MLQSCSKLWLQQFRLSVDWAKLVLLITYALLISVNWLALSYFLSVLRIGALSHRFFFFNRCMELLYCSACGEASTWPFIAVKAQTPHTYENEAPFIVFVFTRLKEPTLPLCCHHEVQGTSTIWAPLFTSSFQQRWCSVIEVLYLPFFLLDLHRHHTGLFFKWACILSCGVLSESVVVHPVANIVPSSHLPLIRPAC